MTVEQLERGRNLLKDIEEYERRIQFAEKGQIFIRYHGCEIEFEEDIYRELVSAQLEKDLNFLKERFENL